MHVGELLVSVLKKLKVHIVIENHRNSLLFGYYKLSFRCLEVNLFSHCFDLKDLNPNKRFEPLSLEKGLIVYLTKCCKCMSFTLPDQTAAS